MRIIEGKVDLELKDKIEFEEETHTYKVNNKILPSVTGITSILSNLEYKEIDKEILEKAAIKGTAVHKAIEDYILWDDYDLDPRYEPFMDSFKKALKLEKFEPIKTEFKLTNGEVCGTLDNMSKLDDKIIIIDYKTTANIHKKLLQAQFGGYKLLCDYNGIKIDKWYGLFLSKTGYKFIEIQPDVDIFLKCKCIYDYIKGE